MEPRVSGKRAERIIKKLRFPNSHRVEARGFAGGIWLLWDDDRVHITILHNHPQFIHMTIQRQNISFPFTAVYGSPQEQWRRYLWRNLEALAGNVSDPWLLAGDFNAVLTGQERRNRFGQPGQANKLFVECLSKTHLLDMGFSGSKFTWKRGDSSARVDRFLCNSNWRVQFPEASVQHLTRVGSDHNPILLHQGSPQPPKIHRPFRFQVAWLSHPDFAQFVSKNWNSEGSFHDTSMHLVRKLGEWNQKVFENIHIKKRKLLARIAGIQRYLELRPSLFLSNLEKELRVELDNVLLQEEMLWRQKSRSHWVPEEEASTIIPSSSRGACVRDMVGDNGEWLWSNIVPFATRGIIDRLKTLSPPYFNPNHDQVVWWMEPKGQFSVRTAYEAMEVNN
ncbi:hypothetical protein Tsubulata_040731 [Turnera subulata]|uniref:Endonuclease/exonuclease/phosphatase domain-containing protein n=1 Tax=Turnera subulata TaxID=218843 RepID=A0A9Q0JBD6_9ROSI|nr:hypothetical protein Tsubulata_040731 [Turnera subulata]